MAHARVQFTLNFIKEYEFDATDEDDFFQQMEDSCDIWLDDITDKVKLMILPGGKYDEVEEEDKIDGANDTK